MMRGTYVHRATEMIDRGTLDWPALDSMLLPYCQAYQQFIEDKRPEIILSEKPMYHAQHLFAGTPDRVVKMDYGICLLDLKSGAPTRATAIQLAAYRELVRINEDIVCAACFAVRLRKDGAYRLERIENIRNAYHIFLAALTVERYKEIPA